MKKFNSICMLSLLMFACGDTKANGFQFAIISSASSLVGGLLGALRYYLSKDEPQQDKSLINYIMKGVVGGALIGGMAYGAKGLLSADKKPDAQAPTPPLSTAPSSANSGQHAPTPQNALASQLQASMLAAGIGDALGRPTEFIPSLQGIFHKYPHGVRAYDDFTPQDWGHFTYARYTDDTAMAKLVMEQLISANSKNLSLDQTMQAIADAFVVDMKNKDGWAAAGRAPGNCCKKYVKILETRDKNNNSSWNVSPANGATGGCGSVMRAHPFGLVFYKDPAKAALWAAEHSKLTHGDPLAVAACASMAIGVAYAVQNKPVDFIVNQMVQAAAKYDHITAEKLKKAAGYAQQAQKLVQGKTDLIKELKENKAFRALHEKVFAEFAGWAAHDAVAGTVYLFVLRPQDIMNAVLLGVHTPGDSDSIASMAGALVGAYAGAKNAIPSGLIERLENNKQLSALAAKVAH